MSRRLSLFAPVLVLALTLCATWMAWDRERQAEMKRERVYAEFALLGVSERIEQKIHSYELILRGLQGIFADGWVDPSSFAAYVAALQVDTYVTGLQAIGLIELVPASRRDAHVAAMRRQISPQYDIQPIGDRAFYAPVIQREPPVDKRQLPYGFDAFSEPARRAALERARDTGRVAISSAVRLTIESEKVAPPSFLLYLPIYAPGAPTHTVADRIASVTGWVFISFRMTNFIASLYGETPRNTAFAIHDGVAVSDASRIYRSDGYDQLSGRTISEYLVIGGHTWTVSARQVSDAGATPELTAEETIVMSGAALSALLALLTWSLTSARSRALRLAESMTRELRESEQRMRHMAQHDPLTDLPNRALFSERLKQAIADAKRYDERFALIFLDLDDFKFVNDNFGHAAGDDLLRQVAQRLRAAVRASDTVGRVGGDEFVILMPRLTGEVVAETLSGKLHNALKAPFVIAGATLFVSSSIGVALFPDHGEDEITLYKNADNCMYRDKASSRVDRLEVVSGESAVESP